MLENTGQVHSPTGELRSCCRPSALKDKSIHNLLKGRPEITFIGRSFAHHPRRNAKMNMEVDIDNSRVESSSAMLMAGPAEAFERREFDKAVSMLASKLAAVLCMYFLMS